MKSFFILTLFIISNCSFSQTATNIEEIEPSKEFDNILVEKINSDSNATSFIIWIKKGVKSHQHVFHTENLYIISGSGVMIIGEKTINIKTGDYLTIPKGFFHALKVTSNEAMKVLSVQSPEFLGKDRVFKK